MKYEKLIMEQFDLIGFTPRMGQVENINNILLGFLDDHKKYVVFCGATGSGKSILSVITSMCIKQLDNDSKYEITDNKGATIKVLYKTSEILSHTNILSDQYSNTFADIYDEKDKDGFAMIKGASHYNCEALGKDANATDCVVKINPASMTKHCLGCEYLQLKKDIKSKNNVITNYSYYFTDKMFTKKLGKKLITVFDEVQLINDVFSSMYELKLNTEIIEKMINILESNIIPGSDVFVDKLQSIRSVIFRNYDYYEIDTIMRDNLGEVYELCNDISNLYKSHIYYKFLKENTNNKDSYNKLTGAKSIQKLNKVNKYFSGKYRAYDLMTKYIFNDDQCNNYVGEYKDSSISFKPIFIRSLFEEFLSTSKYILLMSATISDTYISQTLDIPLNKLKFINAPPTFDPKNKTIYMFDHASYNFQYLKNQDNLNTIAQLVSEVMDHHHDENGIIQTTSFYLSSRISYLIKQINNKLFKKIHVHQQGDKLENVLFEFKTNNKKFLVSPSIWEGVDLPDDDARFGIMIKCPYYSLADARMKAIMEQYPDVYKIITIYRILQGCGRTVRNENDYSITYMLDSNLKKIFNSKLNVWKTQFNVINV